MAKMKHFDCCVAQVYGIANELSTVHDSRWHERRQSHAKQRPVQYVVCVPGYPT